MSISIEYLSILFFLVATFYSMVGFGGGSSYSAILLLCNVSYLVSPIISLSCNLIVVASGFIHHFRNKNIEWKFITPVLIFSVPASYLGGRIPIDKFTFQLILSICLFVAAIRLITFNKDKLKRISASPSRLSISAVLGIVLGGISGLAGIGGGIFLSPILYIKRWGSPIQIAASSTVFILVNSLAGLVGQLQKGQSLTVVSDYYPLLISVFIGGQIGSIICNYKLKLRYIELLTGVLILFVSVRIFIQIL